MKAVEPGTVKRALSVHAAIGLLAGAMLYLVSVTGAVLAFYTDLQRIEQPGAPEMARISPEAVQRGIEAVLASEKGKPNTTHLFVRLPTVDMPRATVSTDTQSQHINSDGSIAMAEEKKWSDFLFALHYTLNIPGLIGMTIVGILGVMMLALSLSGVVALPRIFRDAFRLRARDTGGIGLADWHNRLSVWTLPFTIAVALTGTVIALGTVTVYAIATASYGGKTEKVYEPIFGKEAKPDKKSAPIANVVAAFDDLARRHPDIPATFVIIHDPKTVGQHVQLMGEPRRRLIFGEYYNYDAQGRFEGAAGMDQGALGQQAASSTYKLHFGTFGGTPVKIAYLAFGLGLSAISATGTYIWLGKRRRRGMDEPRLRAAWDGVVWGAPVALVATFAARMVIGNDAPFIAIFWICFVAVVLGSILRAHRRVALPARKEALAAD
ncbi:PepSY-associated TM helix domain-containing protein [Sphingomonas montanisoli]|nr:PepSY-associated TM helix domain-containing protein [Sphingomonas montanisoli]